MITGLDAPTKDALLLRAARQDLSSSWEPYWAEVTTNINLRQRNSYKSAANRLVELQDAATTDAQKIDFQ